MSETILTTTEHTGDIEHTACGLPLRDCTCAWPEVRLLRTGRAILIFDADARSNTDPEGVRRERPGEANGK